MAAWNEIHHIGVNDLLFALGLRGGDTRWVANEKAHQGRTPREEGRVFDDEHGGGGDRVQTCKAKRCLVRRQELEEVFLKRAELQEALKKTKRKRAAALSRTVAAESARDDKVEELQDIEVSICAGESSRTSLKAVLSSAKARYVALEDTAHNLTTERARQRREELRESMPAHMRQGLLMNGIRSDAREGINFSCLHLRTTRRPETVFAILEDGMPGGRLETRERVVKTQERFEREEGVFGERGNVLRVSASSPGFPPGGLAVMPNTPPRCLRGRKEFPPLQVPVNPIQSAGDVGGISTFGEEKIIFRRQKQRARLRKRAEEWWRAGGGTHEDNDDYQPTDMGGGDGGSGGCGGGGGDGGGRGDRRHIAWASSSKGFLPSSLSPVPCSRRPGGVLTV